jgi:hypothetical protein
VPDVVVGLPFANADLHRRCRRGSIQRLDLRFLVNTQHNRVLRRLQIQPHDVGDLGNQFRIGGELKTSVRATVAHRAHDTPARPSHNRRPNARPTDVNSNE